MTIKICTWNINLGHDFNTILKDITTTTDFKKLDFLALQETSIVEDHDVTKEICHVLGKNFDYYQEKAQVVRGKVQANALIWNTDRIKIGSRRHLTLPLNLPAPLPRPERIILRRFPPQTRICLDLEGTIDQSLSFSFFVTHLDIVGFAHKRMQFKYVLDQVLNKQTEISFLAGDFNTFHIGRWPNWKNLALMAKNSGLIDLTSDLKWTHQIRNLRWKQKLDAIFIASKLKLDHKSWVLEVSGSDHLPVFTTVSLKRP